MVPAAGLRFGPHTAEVEAFITATGRLTPSHWRQVLAARRLVAAVSKDATAGADSAHSIQAAIRGSDARISEPMARAGEVLFETLDGSSDDKQIAAWQAMTALLTRSHLPALKFAVHYAPFAALIPLSGFDAVDPKTRRFIAVIESLDRERLMVLGRRWRIDPDASRALLQAVAKRPQALGEEAVAVAALAHIPRHLEGDEGWSAVRTAVHGGRVLGALGELSPEEIGELWAPLEPVISIASLAVDNGVAAGRFKRTARKRVDVGALGPNHAEVAAFIKAVQELSPIQWLRVLDRRKLVASVTREGAVEPAGVVRAILAALESTRELDAEARSRAFAAAQHAAHTNAEALAPLVNAGTTLVEFLGGRSDDEAVATWHALSALVHRHQVTPIKFAASYAPFASAIPVTNRRPLGALVSRYATAVGRLGAAQCAVLAEPWQVSDELMSAVSKAVADGGPRAGEEAAALAAVVTVPMRLATSGGWAAVKTAAFGGRVIAVRSRLTAAQLRGLWEPLEPAIPLASLSAPARARK